MRRKEQLVIEGGRPLEGSLNISGSKNACLPVVAASLLAEGKSIINNVPHLQDSASILGLVGHLGADVRLLSKMSVSVNIDKLRTHEADAELVSSMRASILVLGPMLARFGMASMPMPGGCTIGDRPVDIHIQGFRAMGADVEVCDGMIEARAPKGLQAVEFEFPIATVTGTENLIMAATLADGTSRFYNCACEPEVADLIVYLRSMGANIIGEGTDTIEIIGVPKLRGSSHTIIADRIEAGTFLCAAVATKGHITLNGIEPVIMQNIIDVLLAMGFKPEVTETSITIDARSAQAHAVDIVTSPYPGFPTDMQAQFCVINCLLPGSATITDTVFKSRFLYCEELKKMQASIRLEQSMCHTRGGDTLKAATMSATDLRASASLVIAALAAEGTSVINQVHHLDRGYESIEEKFLRIGASITRRRSDSAYNRTT